MVKVFLFTTKFSAKQRDGSRSQQGDDMVTVFLLPLNFQQFATEGITVGHSELFTAEYSAKRGDEKRSQKLFNTESPYHSLLLNLLLNSPVYCQILRQVRDEIRSQ